MNVIPGHESKAKAARPSVQWDDALLLEEFVRAVRDGRQPQPDAGVGIRTVEIVKAAQASAARDGEVVHL